MKGYETKHNQDLPSNSKSLDDQRFISLVKIIDFLQAQHLEANVKPFTLEEIAARTKMHISSSLRLWLLNDALPKNPRIKIHDSDDKDTRKLKFSFRAPLPVMSRKGLLKLLQDYHERGQGCILVDDVRKSMPNADAILNSLSDKILRIQRSDKQEIIIYDDKQFMELQEPGLKSLWHSVKIKDMTMAQIEDYLEKKGITVVKTKNSTDDGSTRSKKLGRPRKLQKQNDSIPDDTSQSAFRTALGGHFMNTHIEDLLIDYNGAR